VSATGGSGLSELKKSLRQLLLNMEVEPTAVLNNLRHKAALLGGNQALGEAIVSLESKCAAELVAVSLQEAKERLEEITGAVTSEDILERIFSQFCVGK
jgi:tRNA modification GTPase